MYSDVFCKVYDVFGWNYYPEAFGQQLLRWLGQNEIRVLTFERGVEDFTLACGTGTGSIACTLWKKGLLEGTLTAHNPGDTLSVTVTGGEAIEEIFMEGPTEIVKVYKIEN